MQHTCPPVAPESAVASARFHPESRQIPALTIGRLNVFGRVRVVGNQQEARPITFVTADKLEANTSQSPLPTW